MILEERAFGGYYIIAMSDMGVSHQEKNIPNQDAVMSEAMGEDFAIAVSDGVGSCKYADKGSKAAVEAVRETFLKIKSLELSFKPEVITEAIIESWKERFADSIIDDHCATLKAGIKIGNNLMLISIGDGMLLFSSNGVIEAAPFMDDMFLNYTHCLNNAVACNDIWASCIDLDLNKTFALFLSSDGIANYIEEGKECDLICEIEDNNENTSLKEELEGLVKNISQYSFDDRSLGVVKYDKTNG